MLFRSAHRLRGPNARGEGRNSEAETPYSQKDRLALGRRRWNQKTPSTPKQGGVPRVSRAPRETTTAPAAARQEFLLPRRRSVAKQHKYCPFVSSFDHHDTTGKPVKIAEPRVPSPVVDTMGTSSCRLIPPPTHASVPLSIATLPSKCDSAERFSNKSNPYPQRLREPGARSGTRSSKNAICGASDEPLHRMMGKQRPRSKTSPIPGR